MQQILNQVLEIFQDFRMSPMATDQYNTVGRPLLMEKMSTFMAYNEPIRFVMLGFPMKSSNDRDKVLGTLPDMGEQLSMDNFARFNKLVSTVYAPGVQINIISDGHVFDDLLGISDRTVDEYAEMSKDMGRLAPIEWYDLRSFYKPSSLDTMRNLLMGQFGITADELQQRILFNTNVNLLYTGMKRFMEEELANRNFPSGNQRSKAAKILTKEMMLRNEAYSGLVKNSFGSYVRLSMHPSTNNGEKYSFQLIEGQPQNIKHSAWHSAILMKGNEPVTVHKKDAIEAGHELVYKDNRPYMFVAN